jgi:predicted Kef-type K+ transport protein
MLPKMTINVKGTTGLIVAAAIIVAVLVAFPAYRLFLAISLGIGVVFAGLIYLRNKYRPITDKDIENKHPLGLD